MLYVYDHETWCIISIGNSYNFKCVDTRKCRITYNILVFYIIIYTIVREMKYSYVSLLSMLITPKKLLLLFYHIFILDLVNVFFTIKFVMLCSRIIRHIDTSSCHFYNRYSYIDE